MADQLEQAEKRLLGAALSFDPAVLPSAVAGYRIAHARQNRPSAVILAMQSVFIERNLLMGRGTVPDSIESRVRPLVDDLADALETMLKHVSKIGAENGWSTDIVQVDYDRARAALQRERGPF